MYGVFHIRSVSVGLDSQIWYLFIYITGYLNVRKISETMDFRTFVGPLEIPEGRLKQGPYPQMVTLKSYACQALSRLIFGMLTQGFCRNLKFA